MTDFNIAEGATTELDSGVIDDALREATMRIAEQKERVLALALARGYDGVDLSFTQPKLSRQDDFRHGLEWEVWKGEPEPLEPYASNTQRYDFRRMDRFEKNTLLSFVGMSVEDIDE